MQLEDFLEFETEPYERIRVRGTRIGLERIVSAFEDGVSPEKLQTYFVGPLTLEQAYAAVTYYVLNRSEVEKYIQRINKAADQLRLDYDAAHPENARMTERLVALKQRFRRADNSLDFEALHQFLERERAQKDVLEAAGAR